MIATGGNHLIPNPAGTVSQWADENRHLTRLTSAEPGPWKTDRAPYLREPMDSFNDPEVEQITLCFPTQSGKTEIILNIIGYIMDWLPAPTMLVMARNEDAKLIGVKRIKPMIDSSPALLDHVTGKEDDLAGNNFRLDQMWLKMAGANSPADLSSDPVKYVLFDEIDKYPRFSGREANPIKLGTERQRTFWDKVTIKASTPTKEEGLIWVELHKSDCRRQWVPCPFCKTYQILTFRKNPKLKTGWMRWPDKSTPEEIRKKENVWYECVKCQGKIREHHRMKMRRKGVWCPSECKVVDGNVIGKSKIIHHRGYHTWAAYSPWVKWSDIVAEFLETKDRPEDLMGFINSVLAEPYVDLLEEKIDSSILFNRRENYTSEIPSGVLVLTAGVDVQHDRVEVEVIGWGLKQETWSITYEVFHGDVTRQDVWNELDGFLNKTYIHESGIQFRIICACIDTSAFSQHAYDFVRPRQFRRVFAIKGSSQTGMPVVGRPTMRNLGRVKLFPIGTDTAKDVVFARMKIQQFGPGYMHFPLKYDEEYFKQLTAEKAVTRYKKGFQIRSYEKRYGRNEALDCRIYGYSAFIILNANLDFLADQLENKISKQKKDSQEIEEEEENRKKPRPRRKGFVSRFRKP